MVPVRGIRRCGLFAACGRNPAVVRSKFATQHRGALNDSGGYRATAVSFDNRAGGQLKR
jgi:hypothetical protein